MTKEQPSLNQSHVQKKSLTNNDFYFISGALNSNTPICRYINFDVFLNILEGEYWVQRRKGFEDANEKGEIPWAKRTAICYTGKDAPTPNPLHVKAENEKKDYEYLLLKKSMYLPTSCWTIDNGENYLMWKVYTNRCGVCIRTTIGELLDAIKYTDKGYLPVCSPLFYEGVSLKRSIVLSILSKESFYSSENEVRFYFIQNDDFVNEDLANLDIDRFETLLEESIKKEAEKCENGNKEKDSITFDVNTNFINSIILSPFINPSSVGYMKKLLQTTYPNIFNKTIIKESRIKINN